MNNILSKRAYTFLFTLLGLVYVRGLFLPLIDNDSAHHAIIGLRMYLTGDYVNMVDHRGDYIDKPHFLFWISALSYKIFGVTSFAYRLPSFLFTILGTYSIFRIGKELYNAEVGRLAALISASSFCYIIANSDVRMDAILTASIAFSIWQLIAFIHYKKLGALLLASLGMAIGYITKGHVGFVTPAMGIFFYILYRKEWKMLYDPRWLILIITFLVFISPVVYCFYLQYDLHPEKISQGMKGVSGIKYILWDHSIDRITGHERFGTMAKQDRFYFLHTFLWTFAPWSILMFVAVFIHIKDFLKRRQEWLTVGIFVVLALLINFSYFKLPHYLPILAPVVSVMLADFITRRQWINFIFFNQIIVCIIILLLGAALNGWAFPINNIWVIGGVVILLSIVFYSLLTQNWERISKAISLSVATMILLFFMLYTNFYPKLMKYQGGQQLAEQSKERVDPSRVYFWRNTFSSSYNYYSASNRQVFNDSLKQSKNVYWIIYDKSQQASVDSAKLNYTPIYSVRDYEISRMKMSFVDPKKREGVLGEMILAEVLR